MSIVYQCPKGSDKSKKQGDVQSDQKTADLFWNGGTDRSTVILFIKNGGDSKYSSYGDGDHDAVFLYGYV